MRTLAQLLMLITLSAAAAPALAQGGPPPARVRVDAARIEPVAAQRRVTGEIRSLKRALIAAQVEGLVLAIDLDEGDLVSEGEIIARLDDELAQRDRDAALGRLHSAQAIAEQRTAEAERADRDLQRVESIATRGSANETELDAATTASRVAIARAAEAAADVEVAQADLARWSRILADKTIRAPFTGRVVRKETEIGEWLAEGDPVVELVSLTDLEARIDVPEHLLSLLEAVEDEVPVNVPGLQTQTSDGLIVGRVIGVIPSADPLARLFPVRISLPNEDGRLRPLMSVTAMVPTAAVSTRLTINKDALLRDDGGSFVYMAAPTPGSTDGGPSAGPTHQAVPMRVDVLFAAGSRLVVREGALPPGALLLVEGNERVFPTQPLILLEPPPAAQPAPAPEAED
ncbi:MAG: efflux RND transporter periplasmic adaptor subunit [Planctomycetota bacterium]